MTMKESLQQKR